VSGSNLKFSALAPEANGRAEFSALADFDALLGGDSAIEADNAVIAADLAARGFAVFPIRDWGDGDDPKPIRDFLAKASNDPATVARWWNRWPDARVGLLAGERNGVTVLDLDVKHGKDGVASLAALGFADLAALSPVRVRTPSGGWHLFFAYEPRLKNSVSVIGDGIDVKTQGGFVVAPGSLKDGARYQPEGAALGTVDLPAFPAALIPPAEPERDPAPIVTDASPGQREWAAAHLATLAADLATMTEGGRNDALNSAAMWAGGAAAHGFITRDDAETALLAAAEAAGLPKRESKRTFAGAFKAGLRKPISDFPRDITADDFDALDAGTCSAFDDILGGDDDLALLGGGEHVDGFPLTEDGVALAFAKRFRDDLRFDHTAGRWYRWEGVRWRREETKLAFDWARSTCRQLAAANPKSTAAKAMSRASSAGGVERFAQADRAFAVTADTWDRDPWLLGTPGGTVDLRTGLIHPASPGDAITRLTAAAPIPLADFDPDHHCPRWLAFLSDATGDDADAIRFIQQWAGYSLTGDTREEALLFVHGPGGSGKSTAINTLADAMGDYAVNVATETITASKYDRHSTELARLHGARLARASETEAGRAWAESRLKALTGGDTITARFMRCDDFEFKPGFKLTIIGNHAPRLVNVDEAMRRRFNVLPFTHPPKRADACLKDALQAEWPGILSWALQGCLDWLENGIVRPAAVVEATDAYFAEQDTFALWLEARCEVGSGYVDTMTNLSHSFRGFALAAGDEAPMGSKSFSQLMQTRGFRSIKDSMRIRGRGFAGLRLSSGFDDKWPPIGSL
jgi:P4 family phage/plasmid primase-like protien